MSDLHCSICGKELSGGLDTYGKVGEELCFDDYFYPPEQDDLIEAEYQDAIDELEEEIRDLEIEIDTLEDGDPELVGLKDDLFWLVHDLHEKEINRQEDRRHEREHNQQRLEKWKEAVS